MAPTFSGVDVIDQARSMHLAELALDMARRVLKPGGSALIKVFQGAGFQDLVMARTRQFGRSSWSNRRPPGRAALRCTCWPSSIAMV